MEVKRLQDGSETWSKSTGMCTSAEIKYLVLNSNNKSEAVWAVMNDAPGDYGGLPLKEVRFESYGDGGEIELSAVYANSDNSSSSSNNTEDRETTLSFDSGGGQRHVTFAIAQIRYVASKADDKKIPNAGMAINWNGKGGADCEIAGIDVPAAQLRESYTRYMRPSELSTKFKKKVADLVGKVNSGDFKGWEAGEVMFLGMSYTAPLRGNDKVPVTFNFAIQRNEKSIMVAGLRIPEKKGHEYAWVQTVTSGAEGGSVGVTSSAVYIADVVEKASFKDLGL